MRNLFGRRNAQLAPEAAPLPDPAQEATAVTEQRPDRPEALEALELLAAYLGGELLDLTRKLELPADLEQAARIQRGLNGALEGLRQALIGLEETTAQTGVGSARNSLRLKALAAGIKEAHQGMRETVEAAEQVHRAIEQVATSAGEAAQASQRVEQLTELGNDLGQQAEAANRTLQQQVHEMTVQLQGLMERVREITRVSRLIDEIAGRTKLLALNAAIEAARAGEHGRGFAVVAAEVRTLAENVGTQTREISSLVREVTGHLEPVQRSVTQSRELVDVASRRTSEVGDALTQIRNLARSSAEHIQQVAAAAEEQTAMMESLYTSTQQATEGINGVQGEADQLVRLTSTLSRRTEEAYQHLGRYATGSTFHRILGQLRQLALDGRQLFEQVIDEGRISLSDLLKLQYTEIKGPAIRSLQRLFDVSRVPSSGFSPPKYSTAYDALVDAQIMRLLDQVLAANPVIDTATIIDLNGYIPAHPSKFCRDWTGDPAKDAVGNRLKKIYGGASVRGARVGLPAAARLPEVVTREEFLRAGCDLRESAAGAREFLVQTYARDTGEVVILLTVPLYVKGYRFGATTATWRAEERMD